MDVKVKDKNAIRRYNDNDDVFPQYIPIGKSQYLAFSVLYGHVLQCSVLLAVAYLGFCEDEGVSACAEGASF